MHEIYTAREVDIGRLLHGILTDQKKADAYEALIKKAEKEFAIYGELLNEEYFIKQLELLVYGD